MKWLIVGADVGGTNTDVVCLHGTEVIAYDKVPTTEDVTTGLRTAIQNVLAKLPSDEWSVARVNIGTTHFVNALVQRCQLVPVSVVRLCGPATRSLGPFDDFPEDLHELIKAKYFYCNGGYQVDGSVITDVDEKEIKEVIKEIKESEIRSVVISGVFSPVNDSQEKKVQQLFTDHFPEASLTLSSDIGSIGFLERENAAILNESLKPLCHLTVSALSQALTELQLECPFFLTQNDGTIISSSQALNFPVKTFSCGPTNSMRGACHLSGIKDAIVVDIGGTTTDVGSLQGGFPRPSSTHVSVGGVDTNFRMPDVLSMGLGGGSIVKHKTAVNRVRDMFEGKVKVEVGPKSVGYRLTEEALIFGGSTVTASDVAVAYLKAELGDRSKVKLSPTILEEANEEIQCMIEEAIDQMKVSKEAVPVILVGAGSILRDMNRKMKGVTKFILPPYYQVANAVGAALGQVSGYEDKPTNMTGLSRKEALDIAEKKAVERCLNSGARKDSIQILEREEINLAYLPGNFTRIKVKAVGDLSEEALLKAANAESTTLKYAEHQQIRFRELSNDVLDELKKDEAIIVKAPTVDPKTGDWVLSKYDVLCISIGAGILGCGGGGSPRIGRLRTEAALKMGKEIRVMHPKRLTTKPFKGGKTGVAALMGAPGVFVEQLCSGREVAQSLEILQKVLKSGIGDENSEQRNKVIVQNGDGIEYVTDFDPSLLEETAGADAGIVAMMSAEIGGSNAMEPLCVAASLGVPVLDCDGMGRAFPELQMFAPAIYNKALCPAVLVDVQDQRELVLWAENSRAVENHFRTTLGRMGCVAAIAFSPLDEEAVFESCIMFSISRCFRLGDTVLRAQKEKQDPIQSICQHEGGVHLITGKESELSEPSDSREGDICDSEESELSEPSDSREGDICDSEKVSKEGSDDLEREDGYDAKVVDVCRETTGGFDRGFVEIEGTGKHSGQEMVINFQNENLIAKRRQDGEEKIVATTPDLIVIVDSDAGTPITTEEVRYGLRVAALVLPSPPQLRTETALKVVGPRAFKYDVDFTPVGDYQFKEPIPVAP